MTNAREIIIILKASGELHPIPIKHDLWHQVGMDLIGPLTETSRGNKYIVTITDYFSKWAEAGPLPDKTAFRIAKFIYSMVLYTLGTTSYITLATIIR